VAYCRCLIVLPGLQSALFRSYKIVSIPITSALSTPILGSLNIRAKVAAYDDSHVLPAVSTGLTGGVAAENPVSGLVTGGITWLLLRGNKQAPPSGIPILCMNCRSVYRIYRDPAWTLMRCPVCNTQLQLQFPDLYA